MLLQFANGAHGVTLVKFRGSICITTDPVKGVHTLFVDDIPVFSTFSVEAVSSVLGFITVLADKESMFPSKDLGVVQVPLPRDAFSCLPDEEYDLATMKTLLNASVNAINFARFSKLVGNNALSLTDIREGESKKQWFERLLVFLVKDLGLSIDLEGRLSRFSSKEEIVEYIRTSGIMSAIEDSLFNK